MNLPFHTTYAKPYGIPPLPSPPVIYPCLSTLFFFGFFLMAQHYPVLFWSPFCMLSTSRVLATGLLDLEVPMYLRLYLERNRIVFTGHFGILYVNLLEEVRSGRPFSLPGGRPSACHWVDRLRSSTLPPRYWSVPQAIGRFLKP